MINKITSTAIPPNNNILDEPPKTELTAWDNESVPTFNTSYVASVPIYNPVERVSVPNFITSLASPKIVAFA